MRTHYFIFVRPPGSNLWTMKMKATPSFQDIPWITFDPNIANDMATAIASETEFCAMVKPIQFPKSIDTEKYALLADGETKFTPT